MAGSGEPTGVLAGRHKVGARMLGTNIIQHWHSPPHTGRKAFRNEFIDIVAVIKKYRNLPDLDPMGMMAYIRSEVASEMISISLVCYSLC